MSHLFSQVFDFLTSPSLPSKIFAILGAIATLITVTGIGFWGVIGAVKAFRLLVQL